MNSLPHALTIKQKKGPHHVALYLHYGIITARVKWLLRYLWHRQITSEYYL
ncbi:Uncharacterised protein [Yersinia mollaretii]|nr:Uncharacterised protein [Yersinia mollaretii]CQH02313.1 Uncharacterised protein [Yersinia mollaretii]